MKMNLKKGLEKLGFLTQTIDDMVQSNEMERWFCLGLQTTMVMFSLIPRIWSLEDTSTLLLQTENIEAEASSRTVTRHYREHQKGNPTQLIL